MPEGERTAGGAEQAGQAEHTSPVPTSTGVTDDQADFAALVVEATGHHGAHGVVHHSHDICIIVLGSNRVLLGPLENAAPVPHQFSFQPK